MIVVTWNVLHRIHAVNWDEPTIKSWADERDRIASIADFIGDLEADVLCLQEVSGDQLAMLRDVEQGEVFATPYPRIPHYYRRFEAATLRDPTEFLVTIVRSGGARIVDAAPFPSDGGKGFQTVELATGERVVAAHQSYGDKHPEQCTRILAATSGDGPVIVCGDFNEDRDVCASRLGDLVPAIPTPPALPTRPRQASAPTTKSETIDHVFVRGISAIAAEVLDCYGRSDHNPVAARIM